MAGRTILQRQGVNRHYEGKLTVFVVVSCMVAVTGGFIFGYDLSISGGVTSMDSFLKTFFPSVYKRTKQGIGENMYCKFNNQMLTAYTSTLYISGVVASFFASSATRIYGHKTSMLVAGFCYFVGSLINGLALNVPMLFLSRLFLGFGTGFASQAIPLYLSEMALPQLRGAIGIGFQLAVTIGIGVANFVNYGTHRIDGYGWRISVVLVAFPAIFMSVGTFLLPDTPNSLIQRGHKDEAKQLLQKIRGTGNVSFEFHDLVEASEEALKVANPWMRIMEKKYRPQLIMAIAIPFFQQISGINIILFYAPVLFRTLGHGNSASLMAAAITGITNIIGTVMCFIIVDRYGRRWLFIQGGVQMLIAQMAIGSIIGVKFGVTGTGKLTELDADTVFFLICFFVLSYAGSWGALVWLVPSEIFPMEIRSAGQSITVAVNLFFYFIIAQSSLAMLCHLKCGIFMFFSGFILLMTVFVFVFLPETKGVPIEEMDRVWKEHWFWGEFLEDENNDRTGRLSYCRSYLT